MNPVGQAGGPYRHRISDIEPRKKDALVRPVEVTSAACEPVDYSDYLIYGRRMVNADPVMLQMKVISARQLAEKHTGKKMVTQVIDQLVDEPVDLIELCGMPVRAVYGAYMTDFFGVETPVASSVYWVSRDNDPTRLVLQEGQNWPVPNREFEALRINTLCGYMCPFSVEEDMQTISAPGHWYQNGQGLYLSATGMSLPKPLAISRLYYAVNVVQSSFTDPYGQVIPVGSTLQLATTPTGSPVTFIDTGVPRTQALQPQCFLGRVPEVITRAILVIATADLLGAEEELNEDGIPLRAMALLNRQTPWRI